MITITHVLWGLGGLLVGYALRPKKPKRRSLKRHKSFLYAKQDGKCNGCSNEYEVKDLSIDHIKPKGKGGSDKTENLQLLCHNCNNLKGYRTMAYLKDKLKRKRII